MQQDFFSKNHKYLTIFLAVAVLAGYSYFVFAAGGLPPPGGFAPGIELDPGCAPGDLLPNPCIVDIPDGGTPGGNTGEVQFNDAGSFGASPNFFWDNTSGELGIGTSVPGGALNVTTPRVATPNHGVLSVGESPWDGTTGGYFTGNVNGTVFAINGPYSTGGNLVDIQRAGASWFRMNMRGATAINGFYVAGGEDFYTITPPGATTMATERKNFSVAGAGFVLVGGYPTPRCNVFGQSTVRSGSPVIRSSEASTVDIAGAPRASGSATIANAIALRVSPGTSVSSGVTNGYGMYVDAPTGATNNYSAAFATGNVGIGDTNPAALLTVGSGDKFQVNTSGDLSMINNVWYTWPTVRVAGSVLTDVLGDGTLTWAVPAAGGITTLAPIGSYGPNGNGATISGSTLNLEPASALYGGVVAVGSQTFEGEKTFQVTNAASGTLASATGLTSSIQNTGTGTITNTYGLTIKSSNTGGGSIGVGTGLWIQSLLGSTKYAIYADIAGSANIFRDIYLNAGSQIRFLDSDSTNYLAFKAPTNVTTNKTWTLPATDSTGTQALVSNGSGVFGWGDVNGLISVDSGHNVFSGTIGSGTNLFVGGGGVDNILFGYDAGYVLSTGFGNVFLGYNAGYVTSTGQSNVFLGTWAGDANTTGRDNIFLGSNSGSGNTIGNNNTYLGVWAGYQSSNGLIITPNSIVNATAIGAFAQVEQSNSIVLGGTGADAVKVGIGDTTPDTTLDVTNLAIEGDILSLTDSNGSCLHNPQAGSEDVSCTSDERLKKNIKDSSSALDYFSNFRIREYDVKSDGDHMTGVIAQEMELTHPELVKMRSSGFYSVQLPNQWKVVKALQELDLKISNIEDIASVKNKTFMDDLVVWFGDIGNKITRIHVDQEICIGDTCIDETELQAFKSWETSRVDQQETSSRGGKSKRDTGTDTDSNKTTNAESREAESSLITDKGSDSDTEVISESDQTAEGDGVSPSDSDQDTDIPSDEEPSEETSSETPLSDLGASIAQIARTFSRFLSLPKLLQMSW